MSSDEEFNDQEKLGVVNQGKKRRLQRACDICRRKKVRCDGPQMPNNRCSNCIACDFKCTYVEAAKKRGPPKGYVEALETRLDKLQKLLNRFVPDLDFTKELDEASCESLTARTLDSYTDPNTHSATSIVTGALQRTGMSTYERDEDWDAHIFLPDSLSRVEISSKHNRFFGKSSSVILAQAALHLKREYAEQEGRATKVHRPLDFIRDDFWKVGSWESPLVEDIPVNYEFPDADLIVQLVNLYFTQVNIFVPFLHRPTFERDLASKKHLRDNDFASILLLVCAAGSRYSDDPRVLFDSSQLQSAGWQWFHQAQGVRKSLLRPANLTDLQYHCLSAQFLLSSSSPQACWTMVGVGIRLAQEVGAHRRSARPVPWSVENELWKRAFWALISIDRQVSASLGRPCATQDEDFDIELPIECDDEYWEPNERGEQFKQPPGKPSTVAFFISYLKLLQILNIALRTIYCINKSRIILGFVGPQWEQHIVSELDSALNRWIDSVPDHLRWDPNREDPTFYAQSSKLYISYYHLQILIHRPFIASTEKTSPLAFPSLAICTNAARACAHLVNLARLGPCLMAEIQLAVFTAGVISLLTIFAGKKSGLMTDPSKEMADVHKCMQILKCCEPRWQSAGRLWDILNELATVGQLPLTSPSPSQKRERDSESPKSSSSTPISPSDKLPSSTPSVPSDSGARPSAGDKRASDLRKRNGANTYPTSSQQSTAPEVFGYPLPSSELGQVSIQSRRKDYWYPSPNPQLTNGSTFDPLPYATASHLNEEEAQQPSQPQPAAHGFPVTPQTSQWPQPFARYPTSTDEYYRQNGTNMSTTQPHASGTFNTDYYSRQNPGAESLVDQGMMTMWSTPTGYGLEDWSAYLSNVTEMAQHGRFSGNAGQHR